MDEFKEVIFDAEANGLFNWVTGVKPSKIHCAVMKDIHTGKLLAFIPKEFITEKVTKQIACVPVEDIREYLEKVTLFVGHNLVTYDAYLIKEATGYQVPLKYIEDTLIMSQMSSPVRKGGHSLDSWGERVGRSKPKHSDWGKFSLKMLVRCVEDVEINYTTYRYLKKDLKNFSEYSIRLEHKARALLYEQERVGCPIDEAKAHTLMVEIKDKARDLKEQILRDFKPRSKKIREVTPKYKVEKVWTGNYIESPKTGRKIKEWKEVNKLSRIGLKLFSEEEIEQEIVGGPFSTFKIEPFNLASPPQIVERMNEAGWNPVVFTKKGQPKVCDKNLETLPEDAPQTAKMLAEWKMLETRWKLFEAYLDNTDVNGNIHGATNPIGAKTMRCAHSEPNLGNVPGPKSTYGKEARECFTVRDPEKEIMVGADASGIQLRALAHYIGSQSYIDKVCGPDIHAEHGYILEFLKKGEQDHTIFDAGRGKAKTFIYTWIFGGGDALIGSSLGGGKVLGKEKKELFADGVEGLKEFLERKKKTAEKGYLRGLDGRYYKIPSDHLALPFYLQGFEQVIMKRAMVIYQAELHKLQIPFRQVLMVHDEFEAITYREYGDIVGKTMVDAIVSSGEYFGSRCPLDGEYKLGLNWFEVH